MSAASPDDQRAKKPEPNTMMLVWAGMIVSAFLFWYFHLQVLNQMTQLSDGLTMPDNMIFGFAPEYIEQLRQVMDTDALGQLSFVHKTAGLLFPILFSLTGVALVGATVPAGRLRWLLWAPILLFPLTQLAANIAVDTALGATSYDAGAASMASNLVVISWLLFAVSLGIWVLVFIFRARRTAQQSRNNNS